MKAMKKNLFITLMLVLLALPLASCGNDDEPIDFYTFYFENSSKKWLDGPNMCFKVKIESYDSRIVYARILSVTPNENAADEKEIDKTNYLRGMYFRRSDIPDLENEVALITLNVKILKYYYYVPHDTNNYVPAALTGIIIAKVESLKQQ